MKQTEESTTRSLRCVVVGDAAVGKTTLLNALTVNEAESSSTEATSYQEFHKLVTIDDGDVVDLSLVDTVGEESHDKKLQQLYSSANVFLICFSVISPSSVQSVREKWLPSIRHCSPSSPIILVGTKVDLRYDKGIVKRLAERNLQPVTEKQGRELQKEIGAREYFEVTCSEIEVLDMLVTGVVREAIGKARNKRKKEMKSSKSASKGSKGKSCIVQ